MALLNVWVDLGGGGRQGRSDVGEGHWEKDGLYLASGDGQSSLFILSKMSRIELTLNQ